MKLHFEFNEEKTSLVVTGGEDIEGEVVIPSEATPDEEQSSRTYPVTAIGDSAFRDNRELKKVVLPYTVTAIGEKAFDHCRYLSEVELPSSLSSIGTHAFEGTWLKSIAIPNTVKEIGMVAFQNCSSLREIQLPDSLTELSWGLFVGCRSLNNVVIPETVETICRSAFYGCSDLTSITIPPNVTAIGESAFERCEKMQDIIFNDKLQTIGECAFYGIGIKSLVIPDSVTRVGMRAFDGCHSLTEVVVGNSVTEIDQEAFSYCRSLTKVTLPASCIKIGKGAFNECKSLTEIHYTGNTEQWEQIVFEDKYELKYVKSLYIGINNDIVRDLQEGRWTDKYGNTWESWNDEYGVVFSADKTVLLKAPKDIKEYIVPDSTKEINFEAFMNCMELETVLMPDSVVKMGSRAFQGCKKLETVLLSDRLMVIPAYAFKYCSSLKEIKIPPFTKTIEHEAFSYCGMEKIIIPKNVDSIGERAFESRSLNRATVYGLKRFIGANAFGSIFHQAKVDIIVERERLEEGTICMKRNPSEEITYVGQIYNGKPHGFGKLIYESNELFYTHQEPREYKKGYWYDGHFVTGPGYDEKGRRHGDGYFHGHTDEEMDEIWRDIN